MKRKKRGSSRYFFLFILIVILISLLYFGIRSIFVKLDYFKIEEIEITGNENLETQFLTNLAHDFIGQNIYAISRLDVLNKYENVIRIEDIKVSRGFPDKLKIKIIEKIGLFFIQTVEGDFFPIDHNRIVLDNDIFYTSENLPIINTELSSKNIVFGQTINNNFVEEIFKLYDKIITEDNNFIDHISEIYSYDGDTHMIEADTGYKIIFGNDNIASQLKKFKFLEQNRHFEQGAIVDLRFKNQLVIRSEEK